MHGAMRFIHFTFIMNRARKRNAAKRAVSAASSSADTPPPAYAQGSGNGGLVMRGNVVTGPVNRSIHSSFPKAQVEVA